MVKNTLKKLAHSLIVGAFTTSCFFMLIKTQAETEFCLDFYENGYLASGQTFVTPEVSAGTPLQVRLNIFGVDLQNNTNSIWEVKVKFIKWDNSVVTDANFKWTNSTVSYTCPWIYKCNSGIKQITGTITKNGGSYTYGDWSWKN